jgi:hypothetical protein
MALTDADKLAMHGLITQARAKLDAIEYDVDNFGDKVVFSGAVVAVVALAETVARLTLKVGHEWGEG